MDWTLLPVAPRVAAPGSPLHTESKMSSFQGPALRAALDGISGILVTPFDANDAVCVGPLKPVVDRAVQAGVHVFT